jgi:hypothetical protein
MLIEKELAFRLILFYTSFADYFTKHFEKPYERELAAALRANNQALAGLFHKIFEDGEEPEPITKYIN